MVSPQYLSKGDYIGIISPAGKISESAVTTATKILKSWGLNIVYGKNIFKQFHQFAGTDQERLEDLQNMINNPEIKAIFCSRGGYGLLRIIDQIDFAPFKKSPKWIIGFSDITILHASLNNCHKIASLHAPMPKSFEKHVDDNSLEYTRQILFGHNVHYTLSGHQLNRNGITNGVLIGGNLSLLYNLIGSSSDFNPDEKILFIEDLGEYLYHIDRMILGLKRAGKFNNLKGLIVGQFTDIKDNDTPFGKNIGEIIREHVKEFQFPVCFGFPAGHGLPNYPLLLGIKYYLEIKNQQVILKY